MATVIERVRAGATFLDSHVVGWVGKIDPDHLNVGSCEDCPLSQVFNDDYINVRLRLGLTHDQCAALGFCTEENPFACASPEDKAACRNRIDAEYPRLDTAWLHEIAARLETPAAEEARIEAQPEDVGCVWGAL